MSTSSAPVLELAGVAKEYPGVGRVRALDGVDLTINRGEMVAIVGPSGSGKSTLLGVIGALHRPTAGRVIVDGWDVATLSDRRLAGVRARSIGFVFQQFHLIEAASAIDNVAQGLVYRGAGRRERRERAASALDRVGLANRLGHDASKLSGGERQRVAVARALVGGPAIVLADEPTGNLDSRTGSAIVDLFHALHDDGATVVLITHDDRLAASLPRRVRLLDGRIAGDDRGVVTPHHRAPGTGGP